LHVRNRNGSSGSSILLYGWSQHSGWINWGACSYRMMSEDGKCQDTPSSMRKSEGISNCYNICQRDLRCVHYTQFSFLRPLKFLAIILEQSWIRVNKRRWVDWRSIFLFNASIYAWTVVDNTNKVWLVSQVENEIDKRLPSLLLMCKRWDGQWEIRHLISGIKCSASRNLWRKRFVSLLCKLSVVDEGMRNVRKWVCILAPALKLQCVRATTMPKGMQP